MMYKEIIGLINQKKYILASKKCIERINENNHDDEIYKLQSIIYFQLKEFNNSINSANKYLQYKKNDLSIMSLLGLSYKNMGNIELAINIFNNLQKQKPKNLEIIHNLALCYKEIKDFSNASKFFNKALEIEVNFIPSLKGIISTYLELMEFEKALGHLNVYLELNPNCKYGLTWLIDIQIQMLHLTPNIYNKKDKLDIFYSGLFHPLTYSLIHDDPKEVLEISKLYLNSNYKINTTKNKLNKYLPRNKKIRLGYFSCNLHDHPVARMLIDILKYHNKDKFEIYIYSFGIQTNNLYIDKIKKYSKDFKILSRKLSDDISIILKDSLDVAFDLVGLTKNNYLELFINRIAPIQIGFMGYELPCPGVLDYFIADKYNLPINNQVYFSEKIIYLENFYLPTNFTKNEFIITREEMGISKDRFIFCFLSNNKKITAAMFDAWLEILLLNPSSDIVIREENMTKRNNLLIFAKKKGVDSSRIIFIERFKSYEQYLASLSLYDLFLDTSPHCCQSTAVDAIKSDLPILSLPGSQFISRTSACLMKMIGIEELIADSREDYIKKATYFVKNKHEIKNLKNKISNIKKSDIFDIRQYMIDFENKIKNLVN